MMIDPDVDGGKKNSKNFIITAEHIESYKRSHLLGGQF